SGLNVSLEAHLAEILRPLLPLLPPDIANELTSALAALSSSADQHASSRQSTVPLISYTLLQRISSWTRSSEGKNALSHQHPPLDPLAYSMVALLAGTRTSPDRKFPDMPITIQTPEEEASRARNDRRAIVALLNALLSIVGSGAAVYWASQHLAWRLEWRVLLSLFVAMVVATSEGVLYLIWDSRR
ncbi:hypothetical protein K474DRAFT_1568093, partial [Panus rudis PR-1116 ss-1]